MKHHSTTTQTARAARRLQGGARSVAPPPFDVEGPVGERLTIEPQSRRETVGDLARALGHRRSAAVFIDGRPTDHFTPLTTVGVRHGSRVDIDAIPATGCDPRAEPRPGGPAVVRVTIVSGPGCGVAQSLAPGRHIVGRSAVASVTIDDPTVELHHALVDVAPDGSMTATQLAGSAPARLGDTPCGPGASIAFGACLGLGATRLRFDRADGAPLAGAACQPGAGSIDPSVSDPWRSVVHRGVEAPIQPLPDLPRPPSPAETIPNPSASGLVGAAVAVVGAVLIAGVMGQVMFALFALIGAVASFVTWLVGVVSAARRRRRARRQAHDGVLEFRSELEAARHVARAAHLASHPPLDVVLAGVIGAGHDGQLCRPLHATERDGRGIWHRRDVAVSASLGPGRYRWPSAVNQPAHDASAKAHDAGPPQHDLAVEIERASTLIDVSCPVSIDAGGAIACVGDVQMIAALTRSLLLQLAIRHGPADWTLMVVAANPHQWDWAGWLPHASSSDGMTTILDAHDDAAITSAIERIDDDRLTVLVTDEPALFVSRTGPLRRFVETAQPFTLGLVDHDTTVPALFGKVLSVSSTGAASWAAGDAEAARTSSLAIAGVSERVAAVVARRLAALVDPECARGASSGVPNALRLASLDEEIIGCGDDAARRRAVSTIARRWAANGDDPAPRAVIGTSADGDVEIDLVRDGPHGLIAGTTGSGKSELLRTLVIALATRLSPEHLTFVLIDYKGGSTFDACSNLPHTVGLVTDLDDGLAERALISLDAELHRRERLLRTVGAPDLSSYRSHADAQTLPRLVVVIDEFAALAAELPDFLAALVSIAQRGRSLGVHLLLATQRPAGVVSDDIRANTNLRIGLRLNDRADAVDVIDDDVAATFTPSSPGRAALRLGPNELVVFQAARCTGPATSSARSLVARPVTRSSTRERGADDLSTRPGGHATDDENDHGRPSELSLAVAAVVEAHHSTGGSAAHRPWIEPLPNRLVHSDVGALLRPGRSIGDGDSPHDVVGVIDAPELQDREPLRWDSTAGNLALVGALGSGTTSTLISLIAARCRVASPDDLHCHVIDARGDETLDLVGRFAHCGSVVRVREVERLHRLLQRLVDTIDGAESTACGRAAFTVLAIDGLDSLRTAMADIDLAPTLALLHRVLEDGPGAGVSTCFTTNGTGSTLSTAPVADTWLFHLADPSAHRALGGVGAPVPSGIPGRIQVVSTGRVAQIALHAGDMSEVALTTCPTGPGPAVIEPLSSIVDSRTLGACGSADQDRLLLPIGRGFDDLEPALLNVPAGDHVFIGGAAQTGKSGALAQVVAAWTALHPHGEVIEVTRRSPLTAGRLSMAAGRPMLIVVDDAERVEDPGGILADVVTSGPSDVLVAAAARLDAVRSSYGHWTRDVARGRCGMILTAAGDVDGDLLGVTLPRRSLVAPRPGLAWLVDSSGHRLVQVAVQSVVDGESPSSQRGPVPKRAALSSAL